MTAMLKECVPFDEHKAQEEAFWQDAKVHKAITFIRALGDL